MIQYNEIRRVHLEISSLCNASCPLCQRSFYGYPYNNGYPEVNFTLDNAYKIFTPSFLSQLEIININGNFGDIVMNPEGPDIVEYFYSVNPNLEVFISTNGAARDTQYWTRLAKTPVKIYFCIDGLEDTHHLYRQNTVWSTVIRNARSFIDAGGHAIWKMIEFDFNQHQHKQAETLSKEIGFKEFMLINWGRDTGPVFNQLGKLTHTLGNYQGETNFDVLFFKKKNDLILLDDIISNKAPKSKIICDTKEKKVIYITSNGEIYPCCYTGFYPKSFGQGHYHQGANSQLIPLIVKNNALEYTLEECIKWFESIEKSWKCSTYKQGRLVICDDNCGQ